MRNKRHVIYLYNQKNLSVGTRRKNSLRFLSDFVTIPTEHAATIPSIENGELKQFGWKIKLVSSRTKKNSNLLTIF